MKDNTFSKLDVTPLKDGINWILNKDFKYNYKGKIVTAPKKFVTDFASIPDINKIGLLVILSSIFLSHYISHYFYILFILGCLIVYLSNELEHESTYDNSAAIHDFLYRNRIFPRYVCDWILFRSMTTTKMWKRVLIYINVRLFGWAAWIQDKKYIKTK